MKKGFFLLETMVAVSVAMTLGLGIFANFGTTLKLMHRYKEREEAAEFAERMLMKLKYGGPDIKWEERKFELEVIRHPTSYEGVSALELIVHRKEETQPLYNFFIYG